MNIHRIMNQLIRSEITSEPPDRETLLALSGQSGDAQTDMMNMLYEMSSSHDLAHIVGSALGKLGLLPDGKIGQIFKKQVFLAVSRYESLNYELLAVCKVLDELKVEYIPLKGSVIRRYYPEPWLRTSCDVDILVHKEDLYRSRDALAEKLGYGSEGLGQHDISMYAPSGMHIELHYSLIESDAVGKADLPLENVWEYASRVSEDSFRCNLDDAMFYYYHIAHMAKHFVQGGCGVRPFIDLAVLPKADEADAKKRNALLTKGELLTFAACAEQLSSVWFGKGAHNDITRRMERYLVSGGTYGSLLNRVTVEQGARGGRWQYLVSRVWLDFSLLSFQYPSLKKHPYLVPFYQVRRWCKIIFKGRIKRPIKEIGINGTISKDAVNAMELLISDMGIEL